MFSFHAVDYNASGAKKNFVESIKQTGFAVLKNHPIDLSLIEQSFSDWKNFFQLSEEEKKSFLFKRNFEDVQCGFFPASTSETAKGFTAKDLKEFYHYYPSSPRALPDCIGPSTKKLRDQLIIVGKILLSWLEEALPQSHKDKLSQALTDMVDEKKQTLLRVLHYPPLAEDSMEGAVRAAPHEDINLITLLVAATAPGLQLQKANGEWLDVPCEPDTICVNVGDMLQECSNFYYKATTHQVLNPNGKDRFLSRYSIPLFLHCKPGAVLSERYTAKSYLEERLGELGVL